MNTWTALYKHNFWLHNAQSSIKLLLSKVLNGVVMALISLSVLYMMAGWLIFSRFRLIEEYWRDTWMAALLVVPHIMMASIQAALLVEDPIPVYAGEYVYNTIVIIGVFYLTTWIMDRKAEV